MRKTLPLDNRQNVTDPLKLISEIQVRIAELEDSLVGSLAWYSPNAHYIRDTIRIVSIEHLHNSRYKMNYSFRWNVFNPCLDINVEETTNQSVNFSIEADQLVFDIIDDERDTVSDEL